jgi:hypothetical protein
MPILIDALCPSAWRKSAGIATPMASPAVTDRLVKLMGVSLG